MLRGGSFNNTANNLRAANRNRNNPDNNNDNNGFRCARPCKPMLRYRISTDMRGGIL